MSKQARAAKNTENQVETLVGLENTTESTVTQISNTTEAVDTPNNTTTTNNVADTTETTSETPLSDEIIDVNWEELQHVFEFKTKIQELETYFANMCLNFEKNKASLMTQIMYGQNDLYNMAQTLQKSKNIDQSLSYELKLPLQPGEKGYFLRKEE